MDLTAKHREGLREVAQGRAYNASDIILSDLMQQGLVRRKGNDRVLTIRGKEVHEQIIKSGDGPEALKDLLSM